MSVKILYSTLLFCGFLTVQTSAQLLSLEGAALLEKSKKAHDPNQQWDTIQLDCYLQEPRLQNPVRYSELKLNNATGAFELKRNRDEHVSTHRIDAEGQATTLLNDEITTDEALIQKYRLDPSRNEGYRRFYQTMLGLPMSLDQSLIKSIGKPTRTIFNRYNAIAIPVSLKEPVISERWILYLDQQTAKLVGMDLLPNDPESTGERILLEGAYEIHGLTIPRMHHWYDLADQSYSGSDIIIE
ncbi:MAG: DUF6503 family protein [Bacteroidota bacterium]